MAQSSKSAKYAKTTVKKRDASASASADPMRKIDGTLASAAANMGQSTGSASQSKNVGAVSNNNSSQAVGQSESNNY